MPPQSAPRPDPDVLLARIQAEAERARRGRLKIFFGACPGVGKTYAMLAAARLLQEQGSAVLVGVADNGPGLPPGQEEALFEADSAAPRRVGPCASGATRRTPPSRPTRCPGRGIS